MSNTGTLVRVQPRSSIGRTALVAIVAGGLPLFGVLYWLSALQGSWRRVLVIQVFTIAVAVLTWVRYSNVYAAVTSSTVTEQAFFTHRTIARDDVASAVIVHTWRPASSEVVPQLLLMDAEGNRLLRLRGTFWSRESMEELVSALGVPLSVDEEPASLREFFEQYPTASYWFEQKPWLAAAGVVLAFACAFLITGWIMIAIGSPMALGISH